MGWGMVGRLRFTVAAPAPGGWVTIPVYFSLSGGRWAEKDAPGPELARGRGRLGGWGMGDGGLFAGYCAVGFDGDADYGADGAVEYGGKVGAGAADAG